MRLDDVILIGCLNFLVFRVDDIVGLPYVMRRARIRWVIWVLVVRVFVRCVARRRLGGPLLLMKDVLNSVRLVLWVRLASVDAGLALFEQIMSWSLVAI